MRDLTPKKINNNLVLSQFILDQHNVSMQKNIQ